MNLRDDDHYRTGTIGKPSKDLRGYQKDISFEPVQPCTIGLSTYFLVKMLIAEVFGGEVLSGLYSYNKEVVRDNFRKA